MAQIYPDFSTGFANLGTAMFGDPKVIAAAREASAMEDYRKGMLANSTRELEMKAPLYTAQVSQANASAGFDIARTERERLQTSGSSELGRVLADSLTVGADGRPYFNPQNFGAAAQAAVKANPNGDVSKIFGAMMNMMPNQTEDSMRANAAISGNMPNATTAFTTGQVQQLEANELGRRVAVQQAANQAKAFEPVVISNGSAVFAMPNDPRFSNLPAAQPQAQAVSPLAGAMTQAMPAYQMPQSQSAPYVDPNTGAIMVPDQKANAAFGTDNARLRLIDEADASANLKRGTAETAKFLSQPGVTEKLVNPVGMVPGLGSAYDVAQQGFGDADTAFARNMWKELRTFEWLNKSSALKGAISDAENRELQSSFPNDGASADSRRLYLNKVAYVSDRGAFIESARSQALRDGQIPPDPAILRQQFDQQNGNKNPFALQPMQTQPPQSLAPVVAPNATAIPAGVDPVTWQYMTPQEQALFQQ